MDWHAGFMWLRVGTSGDFVNAIMTFGFHTRWKISCLNYQLFKNGSTVWSYLLTGSRHHKQRFYESPGHLCQISPMNSNIHKSAVKYSVSDLPEMKCIINKVN